jgi:uncharacterized protein YegP (UPF0339 family)
MLWSRFEVFQGHDGQWYYRLRARNSRVVGPSEGYTRKQDAIHGARDHRRAARWARIVVLR